MHRSLLLFVLLLLFRASAAIAQQWGVYATTGRQWDMGDRWANGPMLSFALHGRGDSRVGIRLSLSAVRQLDQPTCEDSPFCPGDHLVFYTKQVALVTQPRQSER